MAMTKVLVVNDKKNLRFSFTEKLADAGYDAVSAENRLEADNYLLEGRIDVAIIDCLLSNGQNCFEIAKYIKTIQPYCEIILISSYPTCDSESMKFEPFAYLNRPLKKETLCQMVMEAALKSRTRKETGRIEEIYRSILPLETGDTRFAPVFHFFPNSALSCTIFEALYKGLGNRCTGLL